MSSPILAATAWPTNADLIADVAEKAHPGVPVLEFVSVIPS